MKGNITLAISFLFIQSAICQSIGNTDSRWVFDLSDKYGITEMYYDTDTLIDNMPFKKFKLIISGVKPTTRDTFRFFGDPLFISNKDGLILYRWTTSVVDTLCDFHAAIGDSWTVLAENGRDRFQMTVLDTFRTEINSKELFSMSYDMRQENSNFSFVDTLFDQIGFKYSFIIPNDAYDIGSHGNQGGILRCFTNDNLGLVQLDNSELYGFNLYSEFEFNCDRLTSTDDISEDDQFYLNVYPNPVSDQLHIESNGHQQSVILYNQQGLQISEYSIKNDIIDLSQMDSGVYFLKIDNQIRKVVKI